MLKSEFASACLTCVNKGLLFMVECDVSNHTLATSLNQGGHPIVLDFSLKIKPLIESNKNNVFPLSNRLARAFKMLKFEFASACLTCLNEGLLFMVECDVSNHTYQLV